MAEVENLALTGTLATAGTGNALDNHITGNLQRKSFNDWRSGFVV